MEQARTVLKITGTDREAFLQGLVTNDVGKLQDGLVYAALLTPQGKYLSDFFMVPLPDAIGIDVAEDQADGLLKRLTMYRLRADVKIERSDLQVSRGTGNAPEGALQDPRDPALGWRSYGAEVSDDGTDWTALRIAHRIPESGVELIPDDSYILEMGFERLNGVDFRKGCYVGQEVTARMKHKTALRKGLARVTVTGPADPGSDVTAEGRPVGKLRSRAGDSALAYLRFDRANGILSAGDASVTVTSDD